MTPYTIPDDWYPDPPELIDEDETNELQDVMDEVYYEDSLLARGIIHIKNIIIEYER